MDFKPGQYVLYRTWGYEGWMRGDYSGAYRQIDIAACVVKVLPVRVRIHRLISAPGYPPTYQPAVSPNSLRALDTSHRVALLAASSGDPLMWKRAPIDHAALAELIEAGYLVAGTPHPLITAHGQAALEWEARKK